MLADDGAAAYPAASGGPELATQHQQIARSKRTS
jgi:hypothetical protein